MIVRQGDRHSKRKSSRFRISRASGERAFRKAVAKIKPRKRKPGTDPITIGECPATPGSAKARQRLAWLIQGAMEGRKLNGELTHIEPKDRSLVKRLAKARKEKRQGVLDRYLEKLPLGEKGSPCQNDSRCGPVRSRSRPLCNRRGIVGADRQHQVAVAGLDSLWDALHAGGKPRRRKISIRPCRPVPAGDEGPSVARWTNGAEDQRPGYVGGYGGQPSPPCRPDTEVGDTQGPAYLLRLRTSPAASTWNRWTTWTPCGKR